MGSAMLAREVDMGALDAGFSSTKKRVLVLLKRGGSASLTDLAGTLQISKMATLKHMNSLEGKGLVERFFPTRGRGRPRVYFRLTTRATPLFPEAYVHMTETALGFIEKKLGRGAVEDLLKQRAQELYERHRNQLEGRDLRGRVERLAKIRDEGGYMAEVGAVRRTPSNSSSTIARSMRSRTSIGRHVRSSATSSRSYCEPMSRRPTAWSRGTRRAGF